MLKARRTVHAKYMKTMKSEKQANWSRQVFRIPLPCEVESKLVNREHKGDNVKGMVFMIDMKKKSDGPVSVEVGVFPVVRGADDCRYFSRLLCR